jgi:hypothetical protein
LVSREGLPHLKYRLSPTDQQKYGAELSSRPASALANFAEVHMTSRSGKLLQWAPRVLGVLVCAFLGLFSLDALGGGKTFGQASIDLGIHLIPVLLLLAVVLLAWRWEWVGALVFTGIAVPYAWAARMHPSWILVIAGPLLLVGILYFWSWLGRKDFHAST